MMDKATQDKIWDELSEETQQEYREKYKFHLADSKREIKCSDGGYDLTVLRSETIVKELESMFGTHNLNPKPQIKTWEDVEKDRKYCGSLISKTGVRDNESGECPSIVYDSNFFSEKIIDKVIATMKIAYLIEHYYGGIITEEEWEDDSEDKYVINCSYKGEIRFEYSRYDRFFIAFHTSEQRQEFWSHESNRKLVEQYYMM